MHLSQQLPQCIMIGAFISLFLVNNTYAHHDLSFGEKLKHILNPKVFLTVRDTIKNASDAERQHYKNMINERIKELPVNIAEESLLVSYRWPILCIALLATASPRIFESFLLLTNTKTNIHNVNVVLFGLTIAIPAAIVAGVGFAKHIRVPLQRHILTELSTMCDEINVFGLESK